MKHKYKERVSQLQSSINFQKIHEMKYLKQDINRKKIMFAKRDATTKMLRSQSASTIVGEELNKMKTKPETNSKANDQGCRSN